MPPERGGDSLSYLRKGGAAGLDKFYRAHAGRVLGWAIRLSPPGMDPEDIAQEVFAIALKKLDSYRGEGSVNAWLFGITRNVVSNQQRKAFFRRIVFFGDGPEPPSHASGPEVEVQHLRRRRQVQHALQRLKRAHREVLVLVDIEGATAGEAGEMLGVPVGTVYSRLHHARKAFARSVSLSGLVDDPSRTQAVAVSTRKGLS